MGPPVEGILETALYVEDLERSAVFYRRIFGFETLTQDRRLCALGVAGRQVLLLFKRGASTRPATIPGGVVPPHDGRGNLHMAFAIASASLDAWRRWLQENGVEIESTVRWDRGGTSLYFRDPDRHAIELATSGTWRVY